MSKKTFATKLFRCDRCGHVLVAEQLVNAECNLTFEDTMGGRQTCGGTRGPLEIHITLESPAPASRRSVSRKSKP